MSETPATFEIFITFKVSTGVSRQGPYRVTTEVLQAMLAAFKESYVNSSKREHLKIFDAEALDELSWGTNRSASRPTKLIVRFEDVLMIG